MEHSFWHDKWKKSELGFNQEKSHSALRKHFPKLDTDALVLVPLCGKSIDMLWLLEQGYRVVGVELVESAIIDFFTENSLEYTREDIGEFSHFYSADKKLHLIAGDFLAINPDDTPKADALYDRAALVALPEHMRADYVAQCKALIKADANVLLISFSYDTTAMQGPPFSILEEEIQVYWNGDLEMIESFDLLPVAENFQKRGLKYIYEQTWVGSSTS